MGQQSNLKIAAGKTASASIAGRAICFRRENLVRKQSSQGFGALKMR
ncbi:MAG TPA: hypothetical protein VGD14_24615 [bacterium]